MFSKYPEDEQTGIDQKLKQSGKNIMITISMKTEFNYTVIIKAFIRRFFIDGIYLFIYNLILYLYSNCKFVYLSKGEILFNKKKLFLLYIKEKKNRF